MEMISPSESLRNELGKVELGLSLNVCYNCSTCATICPVALETGGKWNPRILIQEANFGLEERLVENLSPNVWDCSMCELCQEECPQHVNLHETFIIVKNIAALNHNIPLSYTSETTQVYEHGKAVPLQAAIVKRRQQLGLPESHNVNVKEIQTLMDLTPAKQIIEYEKERKAKEIADLEKEKETK
jgi:heterodisulfide reductase subunit C